MNFCLSAATLFVPLGLRPRAVALVLALAFVSGPGLFSVPRIVWAAEAAVRGTGMDKVVAAADRDGAADDGQALEKAKEAYNLGQYESVKKLVEPLAEKGNPQAQILLGRLYENALGVEENPVAAAGWYGRAAEAGSPEAMLLLAWCLELGFGTVKDWAQAFAWTQKAADLGYPEAQYTLAMMLNKGRIVEANPKLAFAWAEKAALAGHAEAQRYLGACYERGHGVAANKEEAARWYGEAERQGLEHEGNVFSAPMDE